jgi:hypothetical protein
MPTTTARPLSRGWALRLLVLGGAFTLLLHSAGALKKRGGRGRSITTPSR